MRCDGRFFCSPVPRQSLSVVQHGNTKSSKTDPTLKTRHFVDVVQEITRSMEIHREKGTILGGVHLELTGEVNEEGFSVVSILAFCASFGSCH